MGCGLNTLPQLEHTHVQLAKDPPSLVQLAKDPPPLDSVVWIRLVLGWSGSSGLVWFAGLVCFTSPGRYWFSRFSSTGASLDLVHVGWSRRGVQQSPGLARRDLAVVWIWFVASPVVWIGRCITNWSGFIWFTSSDVVWSRR